MIDILKAIDDKNLFKPWFKNPDSWRAWRVFLCALFGLPMDYEARQLFKECTKRNRIPTKKAEEAWMIIGRRGGKSFISALIATYIACFCDFQKYLQPGEVGTVLLVAADRRQAKILMRYILGLMRGTALLAPMIVRETQDIIELNNNIVIEIKSCNFRLVRGSTIVAALCDELGFWRSEDAASPDKEVLDAIRPSMATVPGSLLLCLSSPYAKRGELFNAYKNYFGREREDVLVWKASTLTMNPSVPRRVIDQATERDPESAKAEYGAEFRSDIEAYISREAIEGCTILGRIELPPIPGVRYSAFCDPSGGSSDSFTLAVSHEENRRKVLDCIREVRPPFNPDTVVKDFADLLNRYWLREITGDRYGGIWPESKFREYGVTYNIAEKTKSDLYREFLPLVNSCEVELLDSKRLHSQLASLERKTGRGGRDTIDHPFGLHDDVCNAVAGVLVGTAPLKTAGTW